MITALLILAMMSEAGATPRPLAGSIKATRFVDGCGCYFWRAQPPTRMSEEHILFFAEGNGRPALMNLDGKDVWLSATDPEAEDDWGDRPGDERVIEYEACDYKVTVRRTLAPSDCAREDGDCEYINMAGTITITAGVRRESFKVIGSCGC